MTDDLINLKERFGHRYRITWSEEAKDEGRDPMYQIIPCRGNRGHLYPFSATEIGFMCHSHRLGGNLLREFPGDIRLFVDAEDAVILLIKAGAFEAVADRAGAKRRRKLSAEERQRLSEAGKKFRFSRG